MKHICFLIGDLNNSGGTERVTSMIANQLVSQDEFEVTILSLSGGSQPFFYINSKVNIHHIYVSKVSMKKFLFNTILKIRKFILQKKINTLIVVDSISCVFTVPALWGIKTQHICWEHFNFNVNLGVKYRDLGRKLAARYCDFVITLTESDRLLWEQGLRVINAQIISIPNPTPYENIESKSTLEFKKVLAIGRFTYQKGFDLLLDAWKKVCDMNVEGWLLQIVGDGEDASKLKEQSEKLGIQNKVQFLAPTKNITQLYENSSFYCMSSRFEGLPMVLLEAQSFGLPIVAFDCKTGPSEIVVDHKNGFLVKDGDIQDLAENLIKMMLLENYSELVSNSLVLNERYSIESIIIKWLNILR